MIKNQYACIMQAIEKMMLIRSESIYGQEGCRNDDSAYWSLVRIEDMCDEFLLGFENTDPNWNGG